MPELRENAELTAKGIHLHTPSSRLLDWTGSCQVVRDWMYWMCVLLLCLLLALGTWLSSFLRHATTNKQTRGKQTRGGRLPNSIAIYNYTRYAPPFSGASIGRRHLGIGCFSAFQFPRVLPRTLIGKRRAHRVRAVHLPGTNKQNRLSLPTHPRTP